MDKESGGKHYPVLLKEAISFFRKKKGSVVVDATFGAGGHTRQLLKKLEGQGFLVAIDVDGRAREAWEKVSSHDQEKTVFVQGNFKDIKEILNSRHIEKADFILADLGWRLEQIKDDNYGLNFSSRESLSMRLDGGREGLTAEKVVNTWPVKDLARLFRIFGEERNSLAAARAIETARKKSKILSSGELADIIKASLGRFCRKSRLHPATKIFQALRILVNEELDNLKIFLSEATDCLNKGGRLAVITFHSGEDRIVKNFFRANARGCICPPEFPSCVCGRKPGLKVLTAKPVLPSRNELEENPSSRSAKLRVAEKI